MVSRDSILVIGAWVFAFAYVVCEAYRRDIRLFGRSLQGENESALQAVREWFKAFGFIAASVAAIFAFWQFSLANRRSQVDQRPWISMTPAIPAEAILNSAGLSWTLEFSLKNSGLTPALHVAVSQRALFGVFMPEIDRDDACQAAELSSATRTIFPRDEIAWSSEGSLTDEDIQRYRETLSETHQPALMHPIVLVCIAYRSTLDTDFHHTVYALFLSLDQGITVDTPRDKPMEVRAFVREIPFDRIGTAD